VTPARGAGRPGTRAGGWTRTALVAGLLTAATGILLCLPVPTQEGTQSAYTLDEATVRDVSVSAGTVPLLDAEGRSVPSSLTLPGNHPRAQIVPVGVDPDGNLGIPENPNVVGWWSSGARPGDARGSVVIDGHLDSDRYGVGFFVNLRDLAPADKLVIENAAGESSTWIVTRSERYPSTVLPYEQLFSNDTGPRLVLITCGGVFDRATHSYPDNLVVFAVPAPQPTSIPG
jgi:sortase family protein